MTGENLTLPDPFSSVVAAVHGLGTCKWLHGTSTTPTPTTAESKTFPQPGFSNQDSSASADSSGVVKSCVFAPDEKSVVTATGSGSVKVSLLLKACGGGGLSHW